MFTVVLVSDLRRREGVRDKGREKDKEKGRKVGTGRERRKGKEGSLHASVTYHMLIHALFFFRIIFMRGVLLSLPLLMQLLQDSIHGNHTVT